MSSHGFQQAMASLSATNFFRFCLITSLVVPVLELSVVITSPLVSLMVDQVSSLQDRHVAASILSGNKGVDKKLLASVKDISEGCYQLLYSAPEAILGSEQWKELLLLPPLSRSVVAVAVDEAHCVYKW